VSAQPVTDSLREDWAAVTSAAEGLSDDEQAAELEAAGERLWAELERLRAIERRARGMRDQATGRQFGLIEGAAARYILTGEWR